MRNWIKTLNNNRHKRNIKKNYKYNFYLEENLIMSSLCLSSIYLTRNSDSAWTGSDKN